MAYYPNETITPLRNELVNGAFERWTAGASAAPDGWKLDASGGGTIARTANASATNSGRGQYVARLTNALNNAAELRHGHSAGASATDVDYHGGIGIKRDVEFLKGKTVRLKGRVKTSTSGRVSLRIVDQDGSSASTTHTGGGAWETLEVTRTLPTSGTFKLQASCYISSGTAISADFTDLVLEVRNDGDAFFEEHPLDRLGQYSCRASNASFTVDNSVETPASLTEDFDNGGMHDNGTNPSRITAQVPGRYLVDLWVSYASDATGSRWLIVRKNGTNFRELFLVPTSTTGATELQAALIMDLAAGDYVEVDLYQDSGSNLAGCAASLAVALLVAQ